MKNALTFKGLLSTCFWLSASSGFALDLSETSTRGQEFVLSIAADQWSRGVKKATLCSESSWELKSFKLWMPDHGHGSTPTVVSRFNEQCFNVEKINFVMAGGWDLRVETTTGDQVTFAVEIP